MCLSTYIAFRTSKFSEGWKRWGYTPKKLQALQHSEVEEFEGVTVANHLELSAAPCYFQQGGWDCSESGAGLWDGGIPLPLQQGRCCPGESVAGPGIRGVRPPALLCMLRFRREEHLGSPKWDMFESRSEELGTLRVFSYLKYVKKYYCSDSTAVVLQ